MVFFVKVSNDGGRGTHGPVHKSYGIISMEIAQPVMINDLTDPEMLDPVHSLSGLIMIHHDNVICGRTHDIAL